MSVRLSHEWVLRLLHDGTGQQEARQSLMLLLRGMQGSVKRWETVAAYVRTRTVNEVLDMVKHGLKAGKFAPKQDTFNVAKKRQVRCCVHPSRIPFS